jgi:hypothetical protein
MKYIPKACGLSARQQTMSHPAGMTLMLSGCLTRITLCFVLATVALVASSCKQESHGQDTATLKKNKSEQSDSVAEPKVNIKVNRTYDDKGNMIGFDSTYSSYYSDVQGDTSRMDSLIKNFDAYFGNHYSRLFDKQFNTLFFKDSLRYPDFFHDDFFMKRYELNDRYLRGMMQQMDSIKNRFYRDAHRSQASKDKT